MVDVCNCLRALFFLDALFSEVLGVLNILSCLLTLTSGGGFPCVFYNFLLGSYLKGTLPGSLLGS